jgi:hypothetical protein
MGRLTDKQVCMGVRWLVNTDNSWICVVCIDQFLSVHMPQCVLDVTAVTQLNFVQNWDLLYLGLRRMIYVLG